MFLLPWRYLYSREQILAGTYFRGNLFSRSIFSIIWCKLIFADFAIFAKIAKINSCKNEFSWKLVPAKISAFKVYYEMKGEKVRYLRTSIYQKQAVVITYILITIMISKIWEYQFQYQNYKYLQCTIIYSILNYMVVEPCSWCIYQTPHSQPSRRSLRTQTNSPHLNCTAPQLCFVFTLYDSHSLPFSREWHIVAPWFMLNDYRVCVCVLVYVTLT